MLLYKDNPFLALCNDMTILALYLLTIYGAVQLYQRKYYLFQTGLLSSGQRNGPGDGGRAVKVPPHREAEAKETFKINQFNLVASDMMALNRTLPDYRMEE